VDRLQKAAVLTELMTQLRNNGSWCGHTHMQKTVYFLQEVLGLQTGYEYILYKHGPYSFDLAEELTSLRADYLMEFDHRSPGYGPSLVPTQTSAGLRSRYPKTLAGHAQQIAFVAKAFGSKGVMDLEKLATALFVTRELGNTADATVRANRLHALKPHISPTDALASVHEFDRLSAEAGTLAAEGTHV